MEKEGFGEEFSICSTDFFWRNSGGLKKLRKSVFHVSIVVRVSFNVHTYIIILWKENKTDKLGIK